MIVFFFAFLFSDLAGLKAQVLTPPPGSEALQKLLQADSNKSQRDQKQELKEGLKNHYTTQEAEAIFILAKSQRVRQLLLWNLAGASSEDGKHTNPFDQLVAKCSKETFDLVMGNYFRVDTMPGAAVSEVPLHGWRLELDSIKSLITPSPLSGQAPAKELLLIPAMMPLVPNATCNNISNEYLTLIIAGIDANNNIIYKSDGKADLYEYLKPCPNNCPLNFKQIFLQPKP